MERTKVSDYGVSSDPLCREGDDSTAAGSQYPVVERHLLLSLVQRTSVSPYVKRRVASSCSIRQDKNSTISVGRIPDFFNLRGKKKNTHSFVASRSKNRDDKMTNERNKRCSSIPGNDKNRSISNFRKSEFPLLSSASLFFFFGFYRTYPEL